MGEWFEPLEYYFLTRWRPPEGPAEIPTPVYKALKQLGGEKFEAELVHPLDYSDDRIAFVMIKGSETFLFRFAPPGYRGDDIPWLTRGRPVHRNDGDGRRHGAHRGTVRSPAPRARWTVPLHP
jgi:hypothetical protein